MNSFSSDGTPQRLLTLQFFSGLRIVAAGVPPAVSLGPHHGARLFPGLKG